MEHRGGRAAWGVFVGAGGGEARGRCGKSPALSVFIMIPLYCSITYHWGPPSSLSRSSQNAFQVAAGSASIPKCVATL